MSATPDILFMGRVFETRWGGVREMAEALLRAAAPLCSASNRRIDVLVPRPGMCPVTHPAIREVVLPRFGGNRMLWDHWTVAMHANRRRDAVLYNIKLVLPEGLSIPGFTSIHDLMYFPQPAKYDWREYLWGDSLYMRVFVPRTIRKAPYIHTDSHHTARDANELFPWAPRDRFQTIHLGVEAERFRPREKSPEDIAEWATLLKAGLATPYILYTGGISKRKNITLLLRAMRDFLTDFPDYQLAITGGAKPTIADPEIDAAMKALPHDRVIRLGAVSSRALELLYQHAHFFVFPSLYEGFGLPPLEAQAAHCPVICSNASSLPEVVGDSALTFDPRSQAELLAAMRAMTNEESRQLHIARGLRNTQNFTWERTAREWLALADRVYTKGHAR